MVFSVAERLRLITEEYGMGDEQAEVVGGARDVFKPECVLDVAAVTSVTALSDLTHDVATKKPLEEEAEEEKRKPEKFTVLTNLVAVVEGEVKYVQSVILDPDRKGRKTQTMKFPVKDLFVHAPDTAAYSLTKKFSEFTFQPGNTYSEWMEASRLDLTYFSEWKTSRSDSIKATPEQKKEWGVTNFMLRAILTPLGDPQVVSVNLVAVPLKKSEFKTMNGHDVAQVNGSFPSIYIRDGSNTPIRVVPSMKHGTKSFGLPAWPVFIRNHDDELLPKPDDVVEAIRKHWHEAIMVPAVSLEEWFRLTSALPVVAPVMPAFNKWPLLPRPDRKKDHQGKVLVNKYGKCTHHLNLSLVAKNDNNLHIVICRVFIGVFVMW